MKKIGMGLGCLALLIGICSLWAERVYIVIDQARLRKSLISIAPLRPLEDASKKSGDEIASVIQADLDFTGVFDFIVPKDVRPFETNGLEVSETNFKGWGELGTEFLIQGTYKVSGDDLEVDLRLYDVRAASLISGKNYKATLQKQRTVAHRFSNEVMKTLTGEKGIFLTKILFVSNKSGHKELYQMDYDGHAIEQLTQHESIVLSPAWSPDGKKVSYSSYESHGQNVKNVDLSLIDLATKERTIISKQKGLNAGASWSPDGNDLIVTLSFEGNPELYLIRPDGKNVRRITTDPALDVEATFSPDGFRVAFSSGRAPQAHLFTMNKYGQEITRLTFAGRYNSTPSWSPKGDQIVFTGQKEGNFDLYMISVDGKSLRRLTKTTKNSESPSFSADGRHIVFTSNRSGPYGLYMINEDGSNERPLLTNYGDIKSPQWSPYINE